MVNEIIRKIQDNNVVLMITYFPSYLRKRKYQNRQDRIRTYNTVCRILNSNQLTPSNRQLVHYCFLSNYKLIGAGRVELPTIELKAQRSTTELSTLTFSLSFWFSLVSLFFSFLRKEQKNTSGKKERKVEKKQEKTKLIEDSKII